MIKHIRSKRIQGSRKNNAPKNLLTSLEEPLPKLLIANNISSITHLFQQLIQPPKRPNNTTLIRVRHLAERGKGRPIAPLIASLNQLLLYTIHVLFLK